MKNLDWGRLTDDLLEAMVTNQHHLARSCKVTQQSVSNWKTGTRNPGVFARNQLRDLAAQHSLNLNNYKKDKGEISLDKIEMSENILALAAKIAKLPSDQRKKVLDLTDFLTTRS